MSFGWMPFFFMSCDEDVVEPLQADRLGTRRISGMWSPAL